MQDQGAFCLAEDGHRSIKAVLDIVMGCQRCIHKSEEHRGSILASLEELWWRKAVSLSLLMVLTGTGSKASTARQFQIKMP